MLSVEQANSLDTSSATQVHSLKFNDEHETQTRSGQDFSQESECAQGRKDGGASVFCKQKVAAQNQWN
jgi:hypothetical protein